jgi:predicted phage tail protein
VSIFGAGGGGKSGAGGRKATEAKDNLDSTSYAKIIELLSEGEIEGFATPSRLGLTQGTTAYTNASLKDVFFNKTRLLREGASNTAPQEADFNFSNVTLVPRFGTQAQAYVPGFDAVEEEVAVGSDVLEGLPITRTITDTNVDAARITINVPLLQTVKDNGDILGAEINLQIAVQYNSGGFTTVIDDTIKGRTSDLYQRDYIVNLNTVNGIIAGTYIQAGTTVTVITATPHNLSEGTPFFSSVLSGTATSGTRSVATIISATSFTYTAPTSLTTSGNLQLNDAFPVDIRITRITPDSVSVKLSDAFSWFSYTELIYQKLRYPNSAYVALRIDAEQFSSIPSRSYRIRGIKVRIPNNATVDINTGRLTYAGVWSGVFGAAAWTTDPAWILWDLLTNSRLGLGDHIQESTLDKWAFFQASKFASELVATGISSPATEPRFSCNVNIQTQEEAYKLINDMCSVFRAMPFWAAGSLTMMQDRPADPTALFSLANVSTEGFNYEGSSLKTRATVAIVGWLNLELGDIDREVVEDFEGISKYGVITKEVSAFACTSRSQAHRIGRWLLYSERYEGEVVAFTTSLENGIIVRPGAIIEIADPVKAGVRRAGRLSSATDTVLTVDSDVDLPASGTVSVVLPDGIVENRTIDSVAGTAITVTAAFTTAPQSGAMWLIDENTVRPTTWRVLGITEQDGTNYSITAISYDAGKYANVENGEPLQPRSVSPLNVPPETPTNLASVELFYVLNGRVATKLSLTWKGVPGVNEYRIRWREEFGNWTEVKVYGPLYEIEDVVDLTYQVEVYAISATQVLSSAPAELSVAVLGVGEPPANVTGVSLVPINESTAIIQWDLATDLDVLVGGEVLLRHDPRQLPTAEWATSNAIVQAAAGNQTQKQVPLLEGTYFIAFRDQSGNRSVTPVAISAVLPTPQPRLMVKTWVEDPGFAGTGENLNIEIPTALMLLENSDGYPSSALLLENGDTFIEESLNAYTGLFMNPAVALTGEYLYEEELDLGQVYDVNIRRRVISGAVTFGTLFDDVPGLFDDQPGDFDGDDLDQVNAVTYVSVANDEISDNILLEDGDDLLLEDGFLLLAEAWGPWNEYANAIVRARGIRLKVEGSTRTAQVGLVISQLGATAELQQRTETASLSGSSTYTVLFATTGSNFKEPPDVNISPSNMATGDFYTLTSVTRTGFTVAFSDSAGGAETRSFTYTAVGYGREII